MRHTLHTASADILIDLVDTLIRFDSDGVGRADGGARGALNAGLKLDRLIAKIRRDVLHLIFGIEDGVADFGAVFRRLHDDRIPLLPMPSL